MGFLPASGKSLKTRLAWDLDVECETQKQFYTQQKVDSDMTSPQINMATLVLMVSLACTNIVTGIRHLSALKGLSWVFQATDIIHKSSELWELM